MLRTPPSGEASPKQKNCSGCGKHFQPNSNNHKFCSAKCRSDNRSSLSASQSSSQINTPKHPQAEKESSKRSGDHLSPHDKEDKRNRTEAAEDDLLQNKTKEELICLIKELNESLKEQAHLTRLAEEDKLRTVEELTEAKQSFAVQKAHLTRLVEDEKLRAHEELTETKQIFANQILKLAKPTYADAARTHTLPLPDASAPQLATLQARLVKAQSISRDVVDNILNSRGNGPVAHAVSCKGDRVYLTFRSDEAKARAKDVLQRAPEAREVFSDVSDQQRVFPLLLKNVPARLLDDCDSLVKEIDETEGNEVLSGRIKTANCVFSHQSLGTGHVKLMVKSRADRDAALDRGRMFLHSGESLPVVAVDPHREVRRCYRCQRYGHKAAVCKGKERCGKCAGDHRTSLCAGGPPLCVNCGASHHSGSKSCTVQVNEALRYANLFC